MGQLATPSINPSEAHLGPQRVASSSVHRSWASVMSSRDSSEALEEEEYRAQDLNVLKGAEG